MLNLRYHIVSIMAVFLALGIGLALGATFVDSVLINNLESRVDQLEADTRAAQEESEEARDDAEAALERQQQAEAETQAAIDTWSALLADSAATGRLTGSSVVMVAAVGTDVEAVGVLAGQLQASAAVFSGVLWFDATFDISDPEVAAIVAEQLRLAGSSPTAVQQSLRYLLPRELMAPETASLGADEFTATALTALTELGYATFEPDRSEGRSAESPRTVADLGSTELLLVVLSEAATPSAPAEALQLLVEATVDAEFGGRSLVVGLGEQPSPLVAAVRADEVLRGAVATVTELTTPQGQLAFVLGLAELPEATHRSGESLFEPEGP